MAWSILSASSFVSTSILIIQVNFLLPLLVQKNRLIGHFLCSAAIAV
jgi:hypothetical protein